MMHAPGKNNEADIKADLGEARKPSFLNDYKKKMQEAANRFAQMLEVDLSAKGIFDILIV